MMKLKSKSIQYKIIAAIISVLTVSIITSIIITTENQKRNLIATATQTLAVNTDMLNQVIRNIMLSGEAPIATGTLKSIKGLEGFEEVEIYRTNGEVAFSDYKTVDFVNGFQDKIIFDYTERTEEMMVNNEAFQQVLNSNSPLVRELKQTKEMEYFFPILNYAECRTCHGEENFIRGVSHFKISIKSIYDKVNMAGIVLTVFFITTGIVIFFMLFTLLRRLVITRVLAIGRTVSIVATGDLDVQIDMNSSDELGTLSSQINRMILSLKEKKQLEIENALIETTLKENMKYLQNIQEGLLMVDRDLVINENYSQFLINMFGRREIAGKKLTDFLFPHIEHDSEIRGELEMFLSLVFNNVTADLDMIADINPLLDCWIEVDKGKILIDAFVQRIFDEDENVENIMIIFKDKTSIFYAEKELAEERQRAQSELDYIASLLKAGPETFLQFIGEAEEVLKNLKAGLSRLKEKKYLEKSFREIHSLKGTAGYFNFKSIEKLAHSLETRLKENSLLEIESLLDDLFIEFGNIKKLIDRFRSFADHEKNELKQFFSFLESMMNRLSDDLGKKIKISMSSNLEVLPHLGKLKNSIIHLLRNSADHGIEDPFERISLNKNEEAEISLKIEKRKDNTIDIIVADDGSGIDYRQLEKKAREKGFIKEEEKADHKRLVNLIFQSGFSSKSDVSEISGRGVGLDVVKDDVKGLGGTIAVFSQPGKGTRFTIHLPVKGD
ncbi:MAG: Hpt domain-containing protein [Spirochaetaceae bacterium]|nr:Hpt domain-containing protein [Spirochaetaceae bacterium]